MTVTAIVIRGHQVASGQKSDPRFPGGTLAMQLPHFRERGLELDGFHLSTLNLSIAPFHYLIGRPKLTCRQVSWHPTEPAEDFSFFDCRVRIPSRENWIEGLIYFPHPDTKPEHHQPPDVLEVIAECFIEGIGYGSTLEMQANPDQIHFEKTSPR